MTKIIKKYHEPGEWEVEVPFREPGDDKEWFGVVDARRAGDYKIRITANHLVANTKGRITVKAVVGRNAHVDIRGIIKIAEIAQGTDSFLELRVLMLDKTSHAIAEPELEIEANDVRASHAATIGQLDKEQVLYLQSRGMSRSQAQEQMVKGWLEV